MRKRIFAIAMAVILTAGSWPQARATSWEELRDKFVSYAASTVGNNGAYFGFGSSNWCVRFINYCAKNNGVDVSALFPDTASVTQSAKFFAQKGTYYYFDDPYIPADSDARKQGRPTDMNPRNMQAGDLAYFISNGDGGFEHIGIIESVHENGVVIVHGSWSNRVARTTVNFRATIGSNYPVRFAGIARPDWRSMASDAVGIAPSTTNTNAVKTQYRYHRYVDSSGNVSLCPYYGGAIFHSTMTLQYTDWLDQPLTRNSSPSGHNHVNQGSACTNSGCIDPSRSTERYTDGSSNWYYEETRNVTVEGGTSHTPTPAPVPTPTKPNCNNGHTWSGWTVTKAASCGVSGQQQRTCSVCGTTERETLSALSHKYQIDGETTTTIYYVCTNCGDSYSEEKAAQITAGDMINFRTVNSYYDGLFWDVKSTDWFSSNVKSAYGMGLMKGTGSGTFSPGNNVTLAETVTLAARIHSLYYTGSDSFSSYDGGNWYDPYVDYAQKTGIVNTYYNYSRPATREEFVNILAKALPEVELANTAGNISFADRGDITYMSAVNLLSGAGVISGVQEYGSTYFKPLAPITRAEVAAVVGRMVQPTTRVGR